MINAASYLVAVRTLVEFSAKRGDLDLRFTPAPSAQEGIDGHAQVGARRKSDYQRELRLEGYFEELHIKGRADGFDPSKQQLEEIKTYRGEFAAIAANQRNLHWAQAKVYAHLLCQQHHLGELNVALVYFHVDSQQETILVESHTAEALNDFFDQQCRLFLTWARQELRHRRERDEALRSLSFPHTKFRVGQREFAESIYKASNRACCLLAQAPTGIGKTIGSLFPMLKASTDHQLDKIFYLSAKTSGRQLAIDAMETLGRDLPVAQFRTIELVAKNNACEYLDKNCHGESCHLAKGFYDRLPEARAHAMQVSILDKEQLRSIALAHEVCPYYLSTELVKWCDLIIGDYNYYFDLNAMLYGLSTSNAWKIGVLVDEAHNLVSRARAMYSAQLSHRALKSLRPQVPSVLKKSFDRLHRQYLSLTKEARTTSVSESAYSVLPTFPEKFKKALTTACADIGSYFAENPTLVDPALQEFYFDALLFLRLSETFAEHSLVDLAIEKNDAVLCIRNIVPAPFLKPRFLASHSSTLFSATLSPWNYFSDLLGMPENTVWIDVASPFNAEQLAVHVVDRISTRYADRQHSLLPITEILAQQFEKSPGAYLAFFSSFDYLEQVAGLFQDRFPNIPIWTQTKRMDENARKDFLANFTESSQGIGFAVLGGLFGEGIDLPGSRLIGAFIATLGLPQMNPVNEQIKDRMHQLFGAGYDYTYLYPGIQKVIQAAGRVIRTTDDCGVVYLIDDRFSQSKITKMMPAWWKILD